MQSTHQVTELKYQKYRDSSRAFAEKTLPQQYADRVSLRAVDSVSLVQAKRWEESLERSDDATWSWSEGFRQYAYRHPKRFDLAIWYANAQLCGLSIGKPTYTGGKLRLDVIEGAPWDHPLKSKIVEITLSSAEAYADFIGADQIRIMRPVNSRVTRYYEKFGFTLRKGKESNTPTYLWRNTRG
ncbi:conserved hypothetical protein [Vibrio nigripulchritudo SOn1]|uniref:N-acetyltransferase domain-containing protein n=1 Tax=Vibrio nigripulchritudo SOn1 TaxID=1238450 RepID=A0AAV2VNS5_9VIBR|nr:hypothetical protein [Vibrio nigripulchritudo]CCO46324.1 conserved hypothetical protein [Vibrio nigripulchritudo SOn1]